MTYVAELHAHSAYSFLDGASLPEELAVAATELGYDALALTDHDSVSGSMEFALAAAAAGLRALHGAEITLAGGRHLTLLVQDARGWRSLCRLLTRAHARTRDGPGPARPPSLPLEALEADNEGLVCLTGCAARGVHDERTARRLLVAFGRDRLRIELQRPYLRGDRARNRRLESLARALGVPCVATGDVHAHARARAPLQDALVAIREHVTLDESEPLRRGNHSHVLASPAAMAARFADHPGAVAEAARLAQRLDFDLTRDLGYSYPGAEHESAPRALAELCWARFDERYGRQPAARAGETRARAGSSRRSCARAGEAADRLREELAIIDKLGLAGFFLLHHDMLELAREVALEVRGPDSVRALLPPGRGRGSSVSSIVCYLTGLSHVDPIEHELAIGRFLHEEISAFPDIDLDFPRDVRERLIPRVHERYGRDRSALVAAFPTYRARGAIRELGKALGLPPGEIERVARGAEGSARDVGRDAAEALGEHRAASGRWVWLARLAEQLSGLPRHLSQHSGGMIVSTRPLIDCCPVVPAAIEGRQIVQWDKDSCSDARFLKIDLLGLGMLSAVERAVESIARTRGERIDLSRIPYDDRQTYDAVQGADTTGVFQIESRAQMASLRRTRPRSLRELAIQVAIVRPGPIQGGAVNPYISRLQRKREDPGFEVPYDHPSLREPLEETLGTIIFQDQVLEVARAFAGFSAGEAEGLRRAMSRKRSVEAIEHYHRGFVAGAIARHEDVDEDLAERVFEMVRGFSGFGFPKAHGAAFAVLAYQSTWLRVHYAPELLCALLNEQPMGFYPPDALVHESQRRGIEIRPPDVRFSGVECELEGEDPATPISRAGAPLTPSPAPASAAPEGAPRSSSDDACPPLPTRAVRGGGESPCPAPLALAVRIGLGYVRGVGEAEARALVAAREREGAFGDLADLAARAGTGRPALELLAWAGACDALAGGDRRLALWQLGTAVPSRAGAGGATQLALPLGLPPPPSLRALGAWETMIADYSSTALTTGAHPLALLCESLRGTATSRDLPALRHGSRVSVAGLVVARQRPATSKGTVFVLLEDEHGTINLIIPPRVYERHRLAIRTEPLMQASGRLERPAAGGGVINVVVASVAPLATPDAPAAEVHRLPPPSERERRTAADEDDRVAAAGGDAAGDRAAAAGGDFRAVAPPPMSFGRGRR